MKEDLRRTHSGQTVSGCESELIVVVGVGRDFVSAVGVLGIGQEGVLEPGYEFALEPLLMSALTLHTKRSCIRFRDWEGGRNEPPDQDSRAASPR